MSNKKIQHYLDQLEEHGWSLPIIGIDFQEDEGRVWESKLGGCPYLRSAADYPLGENGKPLLFMAQINLKEVPSIGLLPSEGMLQFFVGWDDVYGLYSSPVVRYIADIAESDDGLLTEHPFADEAYRAALPFDEPCRMTFAPPVLSNEIYEDCQIGGYPYFPQDGELEPDEEFLLLQLADNCNIHFGDCGACRFIITLEELVNLDFSSVSYSWDCC